MEEVQASRICNNLTNASLPELREISGELLRFGVHSLAKDPEGNRVLVCFCNRAYEISGQEHLLPIYQGLTGNRQLLGESLLDKLAQESIFIVTEHSGNKNHFATSIHGDLFSRFMMTAEESAIKPLIAFVTADKVGFEARQPLLDTVVGNFVLLSTLERSSVNLCEMISNYPTSFNLELVRGIHGHLAAISKLRTGNHVVQAFIRLKNEVSFLVAEFLKGSLMTLSTLPYAHFVVQAIFEFCDEETVCDCFNELLLDRLVTHPHGHFVHQSVVRSLFVIDIALCLKLCQEIVSRKRELQDQYGYQVYIVINLREHNIKTSTRNSSY